MRWLSAVSLSCILFAIVASGTFVPLRDADHVHYLFVRPGNGQMAAVALAIVVLVSIVRSLVVRLASRRAPERLADARSGRWLAPLAGVGVLAFGILPAAPSVGEVAAPIGYFLYDLRWWWVGILCIWSAWRAHELVDGRVTQWAAALLNRRSPAARLLILDGLLFALVIAWAIGTSPKMRFAAGPFGDEPRYLRYCETWYQGGGVDVSAAVPMSDVPIDAPSHVLRNIALFAEAIRDDAVSLRSDLRLFIDNPSRFRWNRVPPGHNGFVTGKHRTGVYQLHQPGLSLLLMPGYYLDRHLLTLNAGYQGELPADLVMTTTTMLVMLGLVAVGLFRLLRNALAADGPAWIGAALAALTFPTAAFAFQLYPEVPACLFLLITLNYVCFRVHRNGPADSDPAMTRPAIEAAFVGLAAGMLTWLHPRFLIVSALLACVALWRTKGRSRTTFVLAYGLVVFLLLGYNYHITGSAMPNALYAASSDDRQIVPGAIVDNLIAYAFHGEWGLVAHAPWLFAVVPGLLVMVRTRRAGLAALVAVSGLALGIPAAGHALNPAGRTPGRFVMAVVPLMIWPVIVLVRRFWTSIFIRAGTVIVAVLSLDASLAYNWSHEKAYGPMLDAARSGWKLNLAFPRIREYFIDATQDGFRVFVALALVLVVASAAAWWRAGRPQPATARRQRPVWLAVAVTMIALMAWSTAATYAIGTWTRQEFLVKDVDARREAATALGRGVGEQER